MHQRNAAIHTLVLVLILAAGTLAWGKFPWGTQRESAGQFSEMERIYRDESHCLTAADIRGDKDKPISCFCRDTIADARYVYFTYLLPQKDPNLRGIFLRLEAAIEQDCGRSLCPSAATDKEWKWNGPEVTRSYPPEDVIERIRPDPQGGRWVPFTIQLVYRDALGKVTRTENWSSRDFVIDPKLARPARK